MKIVKDIIRNPIPFAHAVGYDKLTEGLHTEWIRSAFLLDRDHTLQAHRGSYKTTCNIVGAALRMMFAPHLSMICLRKAKDDVIEFVESTSKVIQSDVSMELMKEVYGLYPALTVDSKYELELSTYCRPTGRQLLGMGIDSSITGKHASVLTDDIVTIKDRVSPARREATKNAWRELVNIASEKDQFVYNCGTPWHKDDAFVLMPPAKKHSVYQTGILTKEEIEKRKVDIASPSLFAANYELKHISDGDTLFGERPEAPFPIGQRAYAQLDCAYGGEDRTALTIACEISSTIYLIGWLWRGHVERHYLKIADKIRKYKVASIELEKNGDKGFVGRDLKNHLEIPIVMYHEKDNKYTKITTYGLKEWKRVTIDTQGDDIERDEYYAEIMDFNENASHDDAPDSFASLMRSKFCTMKKAVFLK